MSAIKSPSSSAISYQQALSRGGLKGFPVFVIAMALIILMIDGLDIQLLSLVAPVIIDEWEISRTAFGPALAAALIGMVPGSILGGWWGDRIGRLPALLASTLLFGAATAAAAFATDVTMMTVLRIVGGIGFGAAGPNAIALASEWTPAERRGQITSLLSIGTPAGGVLGATFVLGALPALGWTGLFIACGIGSCLFALLLWLCLRESPAFLLAKGRHASAQKAASMLLREGEELAEPEPPKEQADEGGKEQVVRLRDKHLLRLNIGVGLSFFFAALVAYGQIGWTTVMFSSAGLGLEAGVTAIFAFNLSSLTLASLSGFAIRRYGSRNVMLAACLALAASLIGLWIVLAGFDPSTSASDQTLLAICLVGLCGGTAGATIACIYAMMAVGYPQSCRGIGLGYGMTAGRGGGIALSLLGGLILDAAGGEVGLFMAVLLASTLFVIVGLFVSDRHVPPAATKPDAV